MRKKIILFLFILLILLSPAAFPCTGFIVTNDEYILIGNNEDYCKRWVIRTPHHPPKKSRFEIFGNDYK